MLESPYLPPAGSESHSTLLRPGEKQQKNRASSALAINLAVCVVGAVLICLAPYQAVGPYAALIFFASGPGLIILGIPISIFGLTRNGRSAITTCLLITLLTIELLCLVITIPMFLFFMLLIKCLEDGMTFPTQ